MLVFPLPGLAAAWALGLWDTYKLFFVEAAGVLTFGSYWAVKTRELKPSEPEKFPLQAVNNARTRQQRRAKAAISNVAQATAKTS
jgi:hypothetical protein